MQTLIWKTLNPNENLIKYVTGRDVIELPWVKLN